MQSEGRSKIKDEKGAVYIGREQPRKRVNEGGNIMWNNLSLVYEGLRQERENKVKQMTSQESVKIG